jgi:hypothetical protein
MVMRSLILVGITPLPKDIRDNRNNRPGTVRARVIPVLISTARFDLLSWPTRVEMRA